MHELHTTKRPPAVVQSLLLSRQRFQTWSRARAWLSRHEFDAEDLDMTAEHYRVRQRPPGHFLRGSFRTIELRPGIKAVIGHLLPPNARKG